MYKWKVRLRVALQGLGHPDRANQSSPAASTTFWLLCQEQCFSDNLLTFQRGSSTLKWPGPTANHRENGLALSREGGVVSWRDRWLRSQDPGALHAATLGRWLRGWQGSGKEDQAQPSPRNARITHTMSQWNQLGAKQEKREDSIDNISPKYFMWIHVITGNWQLHLSL